MNRKYDVVGIGNALVDIEFKVKEDFFYSQPDRKRTDDSCR